MTKKTLNYKILNISQREKEILMRFSQNMKRKSLGKKNKIDSVDNYEITNDGYRLTITCDEKYKNIMNGSILGGINKALGVAGRATYGGM